MTLTAQQLETPALLINETAALDNIRRFQQHCDSAGLSLRPHIKTHKTLHFAEAQRKAGAAGITCQKISEAEVMAAGGHDDILITYNILGQQKLKRLHALAGQLRKLTVTVDNETVVRGLADTFQSSPYKLNVLIECDTGAHRCGVMTPSDAVLLAKLIEKSDGLNFLGLMTYPAPGTDASTIMQSTVDALKCEKINCEVVSTGGSPEMWQAQTKGVFTEYRIGTYIYNDRSLMLRGTCTEAQCAAHVIVTVVSTPASDRAVIDAGSKTLTSDLFGLAGYGHIVDHPDSSIIALSEEHGVIQVAGTDKFQVGQRLRIIPNHVCVVSNMLDYAWLENADKTLTKLPIDARGCVV